MGIDYDHNIFQLGDPEVLATYLRRRVARSQTMEMREVTDSDDDTSTTTTTTRTRRSVSVSSTDTFLLPPVIPRTPRSPGRNIGGFNININNVEQGTPVALLIGHIPGFPIPASPSSTPPQTSRRRGTPRTPRNAATVVGQNVPQPVTQLSSPSPISAVATPPRPPPSYQPPSARTTGEPANNDATLPYGGKYWAMVAAGKVGVFGPCRFEDVRALVEPWRGCTGDLQPVWRAFPSRAAAVADYREKELHRRILEPASAGEECDNDISRYPNLWYVVHRGRMSGPFKGDSDALANRLGTAPSRRFTTHPDGLSARTAYYLPRMAAVERFRLL